MLLSYAGYSQNNQLGRKLIDTLRVKHSDYEELKVVDSSGTVLQEWSLRNNKLDGLWLIYHAGTGFPSNITSYRNGMKNAKREEVDALTRNLTM